MPIFISAKETLHPASPEKKALGFPDLPPTWGVSLFGPRELWNDRLRKHLAFEGLMRGKSQRIGQETWYLRSTVCPPPLHLAMTAKKLANVVPTREFAAMLKTATQETEYEDEYGLQHNDAGDKALSVDYAAGWFIANCSSGNKARERMMVAAGWRRLRLNMKNRAHVAIMKRYGTMPMTTCVGMIAARFMDLMTPKARHETMRVLKEEAQNVAWSRATEVPEDYPIQSIPMPEGEALQPFQVVGAGNILRQNKSGMILDDMGLGKTIQYIAVLNGRQDFRKILITCKANMKGGWKKAVERFCVRDEPLKVGVVFGDEWPEDADVIIINYDICDRHKDRLRSTLWDSWGIDEGHSISNEEASRTQALLGDFRDRVNPPRGIRVRQDGLIVNLTGTPHPKVTRRWTTLSLVRPDVWGRSWQDKIDFQNRYAPPRLIAQERTKSNGYSYISIVPLEGEPMREAEFQYLLRATGTMTRRLKSSMAHLLPPKSRYAIELPIKMTEQAYAELAEAEADIAAILNEVRAARDMAGLEAIESEESIAQAIIDTVKGMPPNSPDFEKISRLRSNIGKIKAPFVADYVLESLEGDDELPAAMRPKSVIFAHHKEVIATIRDRLEAAMPGSTIVYDGAVSEKKRDKLVDEFQTMHKRRFFIMSLSGASGITLTAANRLYVAEMDWDPLNIAQIEDRIWRIGQMLPCLIGYMFAPRTLDLMVGNTIVKKMTTLMRAYDKMDLTGVKPGSKTSKDARDVFEIGRPDEDRDRLGEEQARPVPPINENRQGELML